MRVASLCKVVLMAASALTLVSARSTAALVERDRSSVPAEPTLYTMNEAEEVCMVARRGGAVLVQPPPNLLRQNGSFYIQGLTSFHETRHIDWTCYPATGGEMCDTLWINASEAILEKGYFNASYTPSSGPSILVQVSYGPEGVAFTGIRPPQNVPFEIPPAATFELRTLDLPQDSLRAKVCEVREDGTFQQSNPLEASTTAIQKCSIPVAFVVSAPVPYSVVVALHERGTEPLTAREIVVTFGRCDHNNTFTSRPLLVAAATTSTTELSTSPGPPPDLTTPSSPAPHGTTGMPLPSSTPLPPPPPPSSSQPPHSTTGSSDPPSTGTSSSQPTNEGHIAPEYLVLLPALVIVIAVLFLAVLMWIWRGKNHRKKVVFQGVPDPTPDGSQHFEDPRTRSSSTDSGSQPSECERRPLTDSSASHSIPSQNRVTHQAYTNNIDAPHTEALHDCLQQNLNSFSKDLQKGFQELKIGQENILDKLDDQNLR